MHLVRTSVASRLRASLAESPAVVLTGPRQVGKSTLAQTVVETDPINRFDLEDPRDLARLADPMLALADRDQTVIIDEAQFRPDLFPALRVLIDQDRRPGRFLILGSASPELIGLSAESLAGRVRFVELSGFQLNTIGSEHLSTRWFRGGLPPAYLAADDDAATRWLDDYITTFLQRDLAALGFGMPATTMRRFWSMLAHYHGQTWNGAELARSIDVSQATVRRYVDALTDALMVRQLQPWHANISKRQVKSPRIYLRDTGLLHRLLGIDRPVDLERHPKLGASWEGLVIEHLASLPDGDELRFWSTHTGAEVDLYATIDGRRIGIEVKHTDSPRTTKSMHSAIDSLDLDHLYVIHRGPHRFAMTDTITAVPAVPVLLAETLRDAFAS